MSSILVNDGTWSNRLLTFNFTKNCQRSLLKTSHFQSCLLFVVESFLPLVRAIKGFEIETAKFIKVSMDENFMNWEFRQILNLKWAILELTSANGGLIYLGMYIVQTPKVNSVLWPCIILITCSVITLTVPLQAAIN